MRKIPVVLVTGFLGSGKTTFLKRLAEDQPNQRMVFLVNELAAEDVDGETLASTGRSTHSVVGGSLFCECKAGEFVRTLREEVIQQHQLQPLDLVLIETSGTADPVAIGRLLDQHGLTETVSLQNIITIVAPAKLKRLLGKLAVIESQLQASDLIIINKTDTIDSDSLNQVELSIRRINPVAEIIRTKFCQTTISLLKKVTAMPKGELSKCEANPFSSAVGTWPSFLSIEKARSFFANLPESILRIKGQILTPEGMWRVERTVDSLSIEPISVALNVPNPTPRGVVFIAHDENEEDLKQSIQAMDQLGLSA